MDSDEEESYKSVPRSEEYPHSQKHQRIQNHPSMAKQKKKNPKMSAGSSAKKARTTTRSASSKKDKLEHEESDAETTVISTIASSSNDEAQKKEAKKELLREKLDKMNDELSEYQDKKGKGGQTLMETRVFETAKKFLFKMVKYTNDDFIGSHIDWVIKYLNPQELQDFDDFPKLRERAVAIWHKRYANAVRTGINAKHNELRGSFIKIFADMKEDDWNPNNLPLKGKEMEDLVLRKGMGSKDSEKVATTEQWANVIDILIAKVR